MVQHTAILTMADQQKVAYDLSNGAIFNDLERPLPPVSRSRHSFDAKYLINGTTYRHNVIEILIGTYTRLYATVISMTLSDLAKYSMTQSVARPLCDS